MGEQNQKNESSGGIFNQLMDLFVTPEVMRRQEGGELDKPLNLGAAQIIFFPDGRKPQVRINSEVKAIVSSNLKPGISKKPGEPVLEHELERLTKIDLPPEDDPDCGHATILRIGEEWVIGFNFLYNKRLSRKHIETAKQFYEAAEFSFERRNWSPFIDNLFSAAELTVKAILLSIPDSKLRKKPRHGYIQMKFNRAGYLGNAILVYRDTFNKLFGMRGSARYLKRDILISEDEGQKLLHTIKNMIEDAARRVANIQ